MRITSAMLADAATVAEGKLYIHGGGWGLIIGDTLPLTQPSMSLVWTLRVEHDEALHEMPLTVDLVTDDDDDEDVGVHAEGSVNVGRPPGSKLGNPSFVHQAMTFAMFAFPKAGGYRFRIRSGESELASVPFTVVIRGSQS
jgi:hypothetical protein